MPRVWTCSSIRWPGATGTAAVAAPASTMSPGRSSSPACATIRAAATRARSGWPRIAADEPVSTFSVDVDTASYAYIRAAVMDGRLPNPDAVRIEEMINYFPYDYPAPDGNDAPFATSVALFQTPWNADTKLLRIGIQGEKPAVEDRPALDLVFLIDTSGSMQDTNKLPLLKQSFRLLLSKLSPEDRVSIVTYAGSSGVVLEPTAASEPVPTRAIEPEGTPHACSWARTTPTRSTWGRGQRSRSTKATRRSTSASASPTSVPSAPIPPPVRVRSS